MTTSSLRLGTRGSRLALIQTDLVIQAIHSKVPSLTCVPVTIETSGDWKPAQGETRLAEAQGGKGLFIKEIEQALIDGRIDCGVHSLKDVPSFLPDDMQVAHVLERADPRDVFISQQVSKLSDLPPQATVGTSSLRRQAIIKKLRPDLQVVPLRGNVTTRLDKLRQGQVDAIILANAGLARLGSDVWPNPEFQYQLLDPAMMLPACGQGIVAIETRLSDRQVCEWLGAIHHAPTGFCAAAERRVLQILDGSCHTPIGAYAELAQGRMKLSAMVASPDGTQSFFADHEAAVASVAEAEQLGHELGQIVRAQAPRGLLPEKAA